MECKFEVSQHSHTVITPKHQKTTNRNYAEHINNSCDKTNIWFSHGYLFYSLKKNKYIKLKTKI